MNLTHWMGLGRETKSRRGRWLAVGFVVFVTASIRGADHPVINLWPEGVPGLRGDAAPDKEADGRVSGVHTPTLTVYLAPAERANGTAVIICPGGGYVGLAIVKEGSEIAEWFNARGVTAFVLRYRMQEYGYPAPLRDALRAIRSVRTHAGEYGVTSDRIGIMGFSAGGHLASMVATLYDSPDGRTGAAIDATSARPDFAILLYPVITMKDPYAHNGSRQALLGDNPSPAMIERMSTETRITKDTPPTFLMHTMEDRTVPVENSLMFYQGLRAAGVSAELHLYEKGPHGIGMRPGVVAAEEWPKACEAWLRLHGWLK